MENKRATFLVSGIAFGALLAGAAATIAGVCEGAPGVTRALGTGFDSFAQGLEPYRSLFLFGALGFLLLGFGLTYLPRFGRAGSAEALRVGIVGQASLGAAAGMWIAALLAPLVASWIVA